MLDSMRARLTLWYTGILALVLVIFAILTYTSLARAARQRTDDSLAETANSFVSSFAPELNDEGQTLDAAAQEAMREFHFRDRQVIVFDEAHLLVAASDVPEREKRKHSWLSPFPLSPPLASLLDSASRSDHALATLPNGGDGIRAFAMSMHNGPRTLLVVIMYSLHDQEEALEQARHAFYIAIPLALLIASLGGYFLARKSLAPMISIGEQASRIGAANLHERLPVTNERNELGRLARIFNDLLSRLDRSFEQQRQFMADASHELRTPVAIVRGESEVALSRANRSGEDYRESLSIVNDEGRRLTRIVEDLFTLARADAGQYPLELSDFYLNDLLNECVRAARTLCLSRGLHLCYEPPVEDLPFRGDEELLSRMIVNLLDNAIKHTPPGGKVHISLKREGANVSMNIVDTGTGIPVEAQSHIFERFYRVDAARSRGEETSGSGAGLGLSIAQWIAQLHGGRIMLDKSDKTGSKFTIILPAPDDRTA